MVKNDRQEEIIAVFTRSIIIMNNVIPRWVAKNKETLYKIKIKKSLVLRNNPVILQEICFDLALKIERARMS